MSAFNYFSASKFVKTMDEFAKENKLPRKLDKNELIRFVHVWYKGSTADVFSEVGHEIPEQLLHDGI